MREHAPNIDGFADHLLSIDCWGQPSQVHYDEQDLVPRPGYEGPASHMSPAEAKRCLREILRYFTPKLPPPPYGLPGTSMRDDVDEDVMDLLNLGLEYLKALSRDEARRQVNVYNKVLAKYEKVANRIRREIYEAQEARAAAEGRRFIRESGERLQNTPESLVYFIASESGPIKIGMAMRPETRLKELQTSHHEKLRILVTCAGGQPKEAAYHKQFAEHRLNGEWFERHPDILAEIERLSV